MKYPEVIKTGDTIGFVAPSFGCGIDPYKTAFNNAQSNFKKMGYDIDLGPNCYEMSGVGISNTPEKCGEELTAYYTSDTNNALISCGGGELMCETMSFVDFDAIKISTPKWYMGFSDNTNFCFTLTTIADVASIYGPNAAAYGMEPWHPALKDAFGIMEGTTTYVHNFDKWEKDSLKDEEHPLVPYNCTEDTVLKGYDFDSNITDSISMSGRMIGGCMDCLVGLVGTRLDNVTNFLEKYKEDGFIWFLECCDLNPFSMRRAMWQMYEAGWFKYCKGLLIGRPAHFGENMFGLDQYEAILYTVRRLHVPVIMDCDIGHLAPMMPLIVGAMGDVQFNKGALTITQTKK